MRIILVTNDNVMLVGDNAMNIDLSDLAAAGIWAVHFDGATGHIEYADPNRANQVIHDTAIISEQLSAFNEKLANEQAQAAQAAAQAQAEQSERDAQRQAQQEKLAGFDYTHHDKAMKISFTEQDRRAVMEANSALNKRAPNGEYYIGDDVPLRIRFSNGESPMFTRDEFETQFFPAFFQAASSEFLI